MRLGPWPGGLNLRDADTASDQVPAGQLRELLNLDVTDSGVLVPRRGCRRAGSAAMYAGLGAGAGFRVLGSVEGGSQRVVVGVFDNAAAPGATTYYPSTAPASTLAGDWPVVPGGTLAGQHSTVVQYDGRVWFVPDTAVVPTNGASRTSMTAGAWTAVVGMAQGDRAFMVRERMFVVDLAASRVYYSKATDPTVWAAPDGGSFDVNPGDGQDLQAAVVVNSQLYLFKRDRTYLFTFTADPAVDGQLTLLNDRLGAFDAVAHENGILLVNDRGVFRLLNNYFARIDTLVPVDELARQTTVAGVLTSPVVTLEGSRLVIGPLRPQTDAFTHIAMNLETGAWSVRKYSDELVAPSSRSATARTSGIPGAATAILYGEGTGSLAATVLRSTAGDATTRLDHTSALAVVSPEYSLATGEYDFGSFWQWKRLAQVALRVENGRPAGDADLILRTWEGTGDLAAIAQTAAHPPGGEGKKIPVGRRAFQSLALGLNKAATTLSPGITDPATASALWIRYFEAEIDPRGGSAPL